MPLPFLIAFSVISGVISVSILVTLFIDFLKEKKRDWFLIGSGNSGKTEFVCLMHDLENKKGDKISITHANGATPNDSKTVVKCPMLDQKVICYDGAGPSNRQKTRHENIVFDYEETKNAAVFCCFLNLEEYEKNPFELDIALSHISALKEKINNSDIKKEQNWFLIGTHLDKVNTVEGIEGKISKVIDTSTINRVINSRDLKIILCDIYSQRGREKFMEDLKNSMR